MKLVWESTGDTLFIDVENSIVVEYWIDQINADKKNSFELPINVMTTKIIYFKLC